jgi:cytochrome P450
MGDKIHPWDTGDGHENIIDHDVYTRGVPHSTFARLRKEDPVTWWDETDGGSGFWAITRYADLITVSRDPSTFTSRQGIRLEEMAPDELEARKTLMEMDPPEHTVLRRLVQRGFTKRVVDTYEGVLREIVKVQLDHALALGEFDFVTELAREVPIRLLCGLLGLPQADADQLVEWGDGMIANTDPEYTDHVVDKVDTCCRSALRLPSKCSATRKHRLGPDEPNRLTISCRPCWHRWSTASRSPTSSSRTSSGYSSSPATRRPATRSVPGSWR